MTGTITYATFRTSGGYPGLDDCTNQIFGAIDATIKTQVVSEEQGGSLGVLNFQVRGALENADRLAELNKLNNQQ